MNITIYMCLEKLQLPITPRVRVSISHMLNDLLLCNIRTLTRMCSIGFSWFKLCGVNCVYHSKTILSLELNNNTTVL